ncbi:hypothetical protein AiwAL_09570 [Acidiphilium sp. AL]|uniref:Uncharacterized protein n=1 Tax=Acidiphilium iwatense TaxID=768198 RepID=A0ABS9E039_9PROT|nr:MULTISPECIES: hypothetical protein [Acidiphilium]MCF3946964.1 hypothetical protein [Acidiphilium iwatense]MCU4160360.1 hypothetical protein [Acidiphilium sp. AL]
MAFSTLSQVARELTDGIAAMPGLACGISASRRSGIKTESSIETEEFQHGAI